jgi:hypothetical protein
MRITGCLISITLEKNNYHHWQNSPSGVIDFLRRFCQITRGLISLWLYKENNKLRD